MPLGGACGVGLAYLSSSCSLSQPALSTAFGAAQTLNTGSLAWAVALAGAYSYMVLSWGGYTFIINLLPIHCLVCVFSGRLTTNLYIAYAPITVFGTLAAASVPVVGFNAVHHL